MRKLTPDEVLLRRAMKFACANEAEADHSRQRRFELSMLSFDKIRDACFGEPPDISDGGRGCRLMARQIDAPSREAYRTACINRAAAQLPRNSGLLRRLLWGIYRNGSNRRETMFQLKISRRSYWWGVKFLLNYFQAQ